MAKKKKTAAKAKAADSAKGPVICFFFYGSIDELGGQLAKFAEETGIAESLAVAMSSQQQPPR